MSLVCAYWRRARAALAAVALATGGACSSNQKPRQPPATPVRVAAVTRIDAPVTLDASGVVEPMQTVAVTTQVTGTLMDVLFREGEYVQAGRVHFRIDPRPLQATVDQARATLGRDEAQAEAGRRDDVRYQTLAAKGFVSRSQADQIHATAMAQQATVEADRAALRAALVNLGYATIRAPISGRTGSLLVRRGNIVSASSGPLVVINQIRPVLVRFPVADQDFPAVQHAVGMHPLPVVASSSDSTQATEHGTLSFLDNAIDSLTGTVTGKASFPNAGSRLWPGELVFLTIQLDVQRGVLAIPNEAVLTGQQGTYVFVIDARNSAQMRNVATGRTVGDMTVVAQGLADGERVVVDGQSRLNPGARVAIIGGADTAATGRLSSTSAGGQSGVAGGDVTGVARGGVALPNAGRGGGRGGATTTNGVAAGVATSGGRGTASVAPAPTMTGLTGTSPTSTQTAGSTPNGGTRAITTGAPTTGSVAPNTATSGTVTSGSGGPTRSTTTTTTTTTTPTTGVARPGATTTGTRPITPTPTTTSGPQRP
jgi:multidrug efflux system membrane fusion protein